ncbi:hypothetical protein ELD05_02710 [Caldicellulosiruptor changbaiensis]|uniref:Uncharacterized protein n=1 Tax=Caldicellulosiruptor changbaiensis TaxID=1222016 RepID=A0A3T0D451_9FIRM|nr:hypothetical protein [Caldicellulosiruptor changbaiensis]AZT89653.1 hypothetical protein ELD05_02710 [Caldicellulosiruptor changbaiensis]
MYLLKKLPFSLAYWAYVFSVGIFVLESFKINTSLNFQIIDILLQSLCLDFADSVDVQYCHNIEECGQ